MARRKPKKMPLRKRLWINQRYRCGLCKRPIPQRILHSPIINLDHKRPRSHGGISEPDNLQVVHMVCNQAKADYCEGCETCQNGFPGKSTD